MITLICCYAGGASCRKTMQTTQAVAIIGGGASGLLTAIQLLSQSRRGGPRVYLIEKQDTFGFGAAYSTNDPSHLLNVRAGNMSGFPDQPRHFLDWLHADCKDGTAPVTPSCFVTRQTYGRYLRSILHGAVIGAEAAGGAYVVAGEAVSSFAVPGGRVFVLRAPGKELQADGLVLPGRKPAPRPPGRPEGLELASAR